MDFVAVVVMLVTCFVLFCCCILNMLLLLVVSCHYFMLFLWGCDYRCWLLGGCSILVCSCWILRHFYIFKNFFKIYITFPNDCSIGRHICWLLWNIYNIQTLILKFISSFSISIIDSFSLKTGLKSCREVRFSWKKVNYLEDKMIIINKTYVNIKK